MGLQGDSDDYGLPKVDIVVPDDARELARDVIAYRRELRQQRRRERWRRLARPFTRYGIGAPLIASAVVIALISGLLMTVVSPRPSSRTVQVQPPVAPTYRPGQKHGPLPVGDITVDGKLTPVRDLVDRAGVIVIVPRACGCGGAVSSLAQQAVNQRLQVWLVADGRSGTDAADVRTLAAAVPHGGAIAAEDPDRLLSSTYQAQGLTAVLIRPDRIVRDILRGVRAGRDYAADLQPLQTPS